MTEGLLLSSESTSEGKACFVVLLMRVLLSAVWFVEHHTESLGW